MLIRNFTTALALLLLWPVVGPASAADAGPTAAASPVQPWEQDQALLASVSTDLEKGGVLSVRAHVADMEQALAKAKLSYTVDGTTYVLTDGPADTLSALMLATMDSKSGKTVAVRNPYPLLSYYLGSYYNEVRKSADALRVLDEGLALSALPDSGIGEHRYLVIGERGAALLALGRWTDVLANEEDGLKLADVKDDAKAVFFRARGYALTELNRLDEAEQAYRDSLKLDPESALAKRELQYIANLKAGGPRSPAGVLTTVQKTSSESGPAPAPQDPQQK